MLLLRLLCRVIETTNNTDTTQNAFRTLLLDLSHAEGTRLFAQRGGKFVVNFVLCHTNKFIYKSFVQTLPSRRYLLLITDYGLLRFNVSNALHRLRQHCGVFQRQNLQHLRRVAAGTLDHHGMGGQASGCHRQCLHAVTGAWFHLKINSRIPNARHERARGGKKQTTCKKIKKRRGLREIK